jgi:hypothetical protein
MDKSRYIMGRFIISAIQQILLGKLNELNWQGM